MLTKLNGKLNQNDIKELEKKAKSKKNSNNNKMAKMALKFKYEDFLKQDIPNLMINIWSYSEEHGMGCTICTKYKKMCINALKKMEKKFQKR